MALQWSGSDWPLVQFSRWMHVAHRDQSPVLSPTHTMSAFGASPRWHNRSTGGYSPWEAFLPESVVPWEQLTTHSRLRYTWNPHYSTVPSPAQFNRFCLKRQHSIQHCFTRGWSRAREHFFPSQMHTSAAYFQNQFLSSLFLFWHLIIIQCKICYSLNAWNSIHSDHSIHDPIHMNINSFRAPHCEQV